MAKLSNQRLILSVLISSLVASANSFAETPARSCKVVNVIRDFPALAAGAGLAGMMGGIFIMGRASTELRKHRMVSSANRLDDLFNKLQEERTLGKANRLAYEQYQAVFKAMEADAVDFRSALSRKSLEGFTQDKFGGTAVKAWELADLELAGSLKKEAPMLPKFVKKNVLTGVKSLGKSLNADQVLKARLRFTGGLALSGAGVVTFIAPIFMASTEHELVALVNNPELTISMAESDPGKLCALLYPKTKTKQDSEKLARLRAAIEKRSLAFLKLQRDQSKIAQELSKDKFESMGVAKADATSTKLSLKTPLASAGAR